MQTWIGTLEKIFPNKAAQTVAVADGCARCGSNHENGAPAIKRRKAAGVHPGIPGHQLRDRLPTRAFEKAGAETGDPGCAEPVRRGH